MSAPRGAAPERTALSWQRTGLGVLAVAGLMGHRAVQTGRPVLLAVAGLTALLGLAVLGALAPLRDREVRRTLADGGVGPARRTAATATGVVVVAALGALVAVLAG